MIRITPIRLIGAANEQIGVVETYEAMRMAQEQGLDLVEIVPDSRPPVCKIMDYGKHKYELSQKERKNRAASKSSEMKEIRLGRSVKIDPHDVKIRVDQSRRFLMAGHKVTITQRFRGREMMHRELGLVRAQAGHAVFQGAVGGKYARGVCHLAVAAQGGGEGRQLRLPRGHDVQRDAAHLVRGSLAPADGARRIELIR